MVSTLPTGSIELGIYFADIGLDVEEATAEVSPPPKNKKAGLRKKMA